MKLLLKDAPNDQAAAKPVQPLPSPDVAGNAQQPQPDKQVTNLVWLIIVISFALILVGAFVTLAMAVFTYGKLSGDLLLTIFTTAAAFLAGLLAPSPTQAKPPQP
jgi:uncharacterized membrane protein YgcG